jgi:sulfur-carrier protein
MPRVSFTPHLRRHVDCPDVYVEGETLRTVLEQVFALQPKLRGYVVDDQGSLRKHVVVFVDNRVISDRAGLTDPVCENSEIFVMQALSGG